MAPAAAYRATAAPLPQQDAAAAAPPWEQPFSPPTLRNPTGQRRLAERRPDDPPPFLPNPLHHRFEQQVCNLGRLPQEDHLPQSSLARIGGISSSRP